MCKAVSLCGKHNEAWLESFWVKIGVGDTHNRGTRAPGMNISIAN